MEFIFNNNLHLTHLVLVRNHQPSRRLASTMPASVMRLYKASLDSSLDVLTPNPHRKTHRKTHHHKTHHRRRRHDWKRKNPSENDHEEEKDSRCWLNHLSFEVSHPPNPFHPFCQAKEDTVHHHHIFQVCSLLRWFCFLWNTSSCDSGF